MSDGTNLPQNPGDDQDDPESGVNLKVIYSLIALAILAAIAIATFIVLPFYHRR